jgi:hypothetical protein
MNNNYFKNTDGTLTFFNDMSEGGVILALRRAKKNDTVAAVFRPVPTPGLWDSLPIVGHRGRRAILADLAACDADTPVDHLDALHYELDAIHEAFASVGRTVPGKIAA